MASDFYILMIVVHKDEGLMNQVEKAINTFEAKYLHERGLILYDNARSHKKITVEC